ncbi:serine hydrolase [Virgibacillus sp. DJP39]|uniref:serine hydrolase n=1 Tax=Virgibacillus sp. DJP39 TaxID=3409790 RepID=UPI003BB7A0A4
MNFQLMKSTVYELIHDEIDHFSIYIQTDDGDIAINAYEPKRAASTIKLPILIEAYRQIDANALQPDSLVYIENDMKTGGSGVISYLTNSNVFSYKNLLELMIIVSDNTASNIILNKIGMENVNDFVSSVGCTHTRIGRKFMDYKDPLHDNYTSARDMVEFLRLIENDNDILTDTSKKEIKKILLDQQTNHKIPRYAEQSDSEKLLIYHKTGELPGIEHDVALLTYQDKKVYMSLLSEGWSNNGTGNDYLAAIGKTVLTYIKS